MTGRALYDRVCDARKFTERRNRYDGSTAFAEDAPPAWPYLCSRDRAAYNLAATKLRAVR